MDINWSDLWELTLPWAEIVIRGSAIYWFLLILFRVVLRRGVGSVGIADILMVVIIADASQNAMAGPSTSIVDGMLLIATLAAWNLLLDWLAYRFQWVDKLMTSPPLVLVKHGKLHRANMRREFLSQDELMSKLRNNGIEHLKEVKYAIMEGDGEISVIKQQDKQ